MPDPDLLNRRLDDLARTLEASGDGLGLLALGSVGQETGRLDRWSDLDFFLVVRPGTRPGFLEDPDWFSRTAPVSWVFRNTRDGYKLLFADGVFAEMAWFEPQGLAEVPYAPGRWVWRHPDLDPALSQPRNPGAPVWLPESAPWALGELLSCLYVGLCRWNRGEKLSAWRFVQGYCLDRFLELVDLTLPTDAPFADRYSRERRWERRHPDLAGLLPGFLGGYEDTPRSALALLDWCQARFEVNRDLESRIRALARPDASGAPGAP